jgi:hypothetical protein
MSVTVDRFDGKLTNSDGTLKLLINEHIQVVTPDGKQFFDENGFADRMLLVFHDNADDKIPEKVTAWKIIVLYEKAVHPIYEFEVPVPPVCEIPNEIADYYPGLGITEIVVNGETIDAPAPYYSVGSDGIIMLPLRAIAAALGFDVFWDNEVKAVRIGNAINLWIGKDYYTVGRMAPITGLGAAPELNENRTFVPIAFFREVLKGYNINIVDNRIVIETETE